MSDNRLRYPVLETKRARGISVFGALLALLFMPGCGLMIHPGGDPPPSWGAGIKVDADGRLDAQVNGEIIGPLRKYLGGATSGPRLDEVYYVSLADAQPPVPVLAHVEYHGDEARLVPNVPLSRGRTYVVVFDSGKVLGESPHPHRTEVTVPTEGIPSTSRVTAVYPGQGAVPANLLKFYVHFSEPMSEGRLFDYARLLDGSGKPVPQAFREVELWADHHRRVTLWINPGRTKEALGLSESLGPVLMPNRSYTLVIRAGMPDEKGRPLGQTFQLPFHTTAADHIQPKIDGWRIIPPAAGIKSTLQVRFGETLDYALAQDGISVETADGQPVSGALDVGSDAAGFTFAPSEPWRSGSYRLKAAGVVEDLAGNSLYRPFEAPTGQAAKPLAVPPSFHREFKVE